jgi:L-aspartate oxidase
MPDTNATEQALRQMMAMHVGVIRDGDGLAQAMAAITRIERTSRAQPTLHNMAVAALLIAAAAWRRRESRGAHFRSDCPHADASQAHRTFLTLSDARAIAEEAAAGVARVAQPAT